jgi:hypothetical protein
LSKVKLRLGRTLFFSAIVVFFLELCLESTVSAFVNFIVGSEIKASGDYISILLALTFLTFNLTLAIALPFLILTAWKGNSESKLDIQIHEILENLRGSTKLSIFYHTSFIVRRLFFAISLFAFESSLSF